MGKNDTDRVAILGAGAVGGFVGGMIAREGTPASLLCRPDQKKAILERGLELEGPLGTFTVLADDLDSPSPSPEQRALCVTESARKAVDGADLIFVCVKSQNTKSLLAEIAEAVRPDATLVLLQNGVRNLETAQAIFPNHLVLESVVLFNALYLEPGKVTLTATESIIFDSGMADRPAAQAAKRLLEKAGISVRFNRNVRGVLWTKLIINLNNGVSALTGTTLFQGLGDPHVRYLCRRLMAEGMNVLAKAGIALEPMPAVDPARLMWLLRMPGPVAVFIMKKIIKPYQDVQSSTWQSRVRGRPTEIAYLSGEIVRLSKEQRVPAPLNERILELVEEMEKQTELKTLTPKQLVQTLGI
jgi:2-dehydropantoate 2-reductase